MAVSELCGVSSDQRPDSGGTGRAQGRGCTLRTHSPSESTPRAVGGGGQFCPSHRRRFQVRHPALLRPGPSPLRLVVTLVRAPHCPGP